MTRNILPSRSRTKQNRHQRKSLCLQSQQLSAFDISFSGTGMDSRKAEMKQMLCAWICLTTTNCLLCELMLQVYSRASSWLTLSKVNKIIFNFFFVSSERLQLFVLFIFKSTQRQGPNQERNLSLSCSRIFRSKVFGRLKFLRSLGGYVGLWLSSRGINFLKDFSWRFTDFCKGFDQSLFSNWAQFWSFLLISLMRPSFSINRHYYQFINSTNTKFQSRQ